ncbi:DUF664 domain-containing protein [Chitinophaga sp. SYP-B3965]|uniref:DinB family protein n=1 Tax=Chitinophaga sp. SYP-B3965 TaxID=2663120 RepID=UPI00129998B1|nr:DinB family protein [Chitinophaga sp. SYP-B3965]MRG45952.1 DUF664 domain-containing protein [Chitinophaga sp. SYP-B3965]
MPRPLSQEYGKYYHGYISLVPEDELSLAFDNQTAATLQFLEGIPESKLNYAYAPGKWTVKQVLQHLTDAERIFVYRALRFARKDSTPLASFEENDYAEVARVDHLHWKDMLEEFRLLRNSSAHFFRVLNEEELSRSGKASGVDITVRSLGFITVGHAMHHQNVLKERYF